MAIIMGKDCIEAIYGLMGWKGLRQGETFHLKMNAPLPLLKSGNIFVPPPPHFNTAKISSYCVKTTPKLVVPPPPFSMTKTFTPPPPFVRVKLHMLMAPNLHPGVTFVKLRVRHESKPTLPS